MSEMVIALLGALVGGLLVWALHLRKKAQSLPGEREAIERRREELREEEARAVEEARERREEQQDEELVDWLNGLVRRLRGDR